MFLGISDVTAKYLSASLPSIEIAWLRFLVFAMIMVPAMVPGSPLFALKTGSVPSAIDARRRAARLLAVLHLRPALFADRGSLRHRLRLAAVRHRAVDHLPSEKVGVRRWLATAVGLIGVLVILRPGSGAFHPAAFFPLVSALAWACTLIMTRMMSGRSTPSPS